jgi:DNA-binding Lrp family transcriptional regulator
MSEDFSENEQKVLWALCQDPQANAREISEAVNIKLSTVTACQNRLMGARIIKKVYFPAYTRLGYPLVSYSQLRAQRPQDGLLKALSKYQGLQLNETNRSLVSYMATDPLNTFVMAHHADYTAFTQFERGFGPDAKWAHQVLSMDKALSVVNFDHTNLVNRRFFPKQFEQFKPKPIDMTAFRFRRIEKRVFDALLGHQNDVLSPLAKKASVTRQSVMNMHRKFKKERILERRTFLDLENFGIKILSVLQFKTKGEQTNEVSKLNRLLGPFYYWVFDDLHVLMVGSTDYKELVSGLGKLSSVAKVSDLQWQSFDIGKDGQA